MTIRLLLYKLLSRELIEDPSDKPLEIAMTPQPSLDKEVQPPLADPVLMNNKLCTLQAVFIQSRTNCINV